MNILVISHMYPSKNNKVYGTYVHEQIKELIKLGHNIKVISPVPYVPILLRKMKKRWKNYNEFPKKDIVDDVEVFYPRYIAPPRNFNFNNSGKRMYLGVKKTLKRIHQDFKFELIHAHVALPDGYAAMLAAKKYNVPYVTTIHGQDFQHTIHKSKKCKNKIINVLSNSEKNILVSSKLKKIKKQYLPLLGKDKFIIINNGVNSLFLENTYELNKESNKIHILSVSSLFKEKGIDLNIYAISRLVEKYPEIKYQIIGEGPEKKKLEDIVKKLDLQHHVSFLGNKSRVYVRNYMANSDIFLLPSWNEAFGVVYIEAMASKLPVIACKGEGIEDVIEDGINGYLVNPLDVDDIVKKVSYLIENPEERDRIKNIAHKTISSNYSWKKIATRISRVYTECNGAE